MQIREDLGHLIGNTPLIYLRQVSEATGCRILGKAEFMNPGQSVKDRPALHMVLEAEKRGDLKLGGLIVEGTAGNTGIPDTQAQEKKDMLHLCGAELIEVPALPYKDPNSYQHVARRLANSLRQSEPNGILFADQWNNLDNRKAHYLTTGPEIWVDTNGNIDGFICSVGTGGTIAGVSSFLREVKSDIVIGCADPQGAAMCEYFSHGEAKSSTGSSIAEGIGLGRETAIISDIKVDQPMTIPDSEALPYIFDLAANEGMIVGGSSAINIAGAVRLARELGPGHTIVTILCDYGTRYQSKLFNRSFLEGKKLPIPNWLKKEVGSHSDLFVENKT
jgi:cysteine synthase A